jgi:MFS family permease
MALGILLAAGFMTLLDVSIVNVALPRIERGLHAQENALQWIVAGYALALGLVLASSHGNFAPAFRMGIVSIAAVVFAALVLVLTDAFTREQRRHVGKPKERA